MACRWRYQRHQPIDRGTARPRRENPRYVPLLCFSILSALTSDESGAPFHVEKLKADDLKAGVAKCSWLPTVDHPGIPCEQAEALAPMLVAGMLLGTSAGALKVTDEWNRLLPDYQFAQAAEFLVEAWCDKV
jgi:hypothetical protein